MPEHHTRRGIVAAGDTQTADAGAAVLAAGGNAVDAVCAAAFAAFVAEMPLCSPAGAGVLMAGDADSGFQCIDFFTLAPGLGNDAPPAELDFHGVVVDFGPATQTFHVGRGAASVPTAVFGIMEAHRTMGRMPLRDVIDPAMALARDGYILSAAQAWVFHLLSPIGTLTEGARTLFCQGDAVATAGARMTNPRLADFFDALAREGEAFLRGPFAEEVVGVCGPAAGGLLTAEDMARYRPVHREPLALPCRDNVVLLNPPPSSGGTLIGLGLRIASAMTQGDLGPFLSADHVLNVIALQAVLSEVRAAGYDENIRDPGSVEEMLALASISRGHARLRALRSSGVAPSPGDPESPLGSTTHISVLDGDGGAASLTISNGEGCGWVLPSFGIHMNNFLGEEDINPGGFHTLGPGEPMTTMMSPTVVLDADGRPELVLGSGGSNRIRGAILQGLINRLLYRQPLETVVQAPRSHVEGALVSFETPGSPKTSSLRWKDAGRSGCASTSRACSSAAFTPSPAPATTSTAPATPAAAAPSPNRSNSPEVPPSVQLQGLPTKRCGKHREEA